MKYLFELRVLKKAIVLGKFKKGNKGKVLRKVRSLIVSGSFLPEKETRPFFLSRYLYDSKMRVVKTETAPLEIETNNGQIFLSTEWIFTAK